MSDRASRRRPVVLAMLMLVIVISVIDKMIFAFAGPALIRDLHLTPLQFGFAGSAFFFLYSISGILVGLLSNRVPTRWLLIGMAVVWSVAQFIVTSAGSFGALVFSRVLLGTGTGPGTAVTQHATFKWFQGKDRIIASTMIQLSLMIGGLAASAALPLLVHSWGWRSCYLGLGIVSGIWTLLWLVGGQEGRTAESLDDAEEVDRSPAGYRSLLSNSTFLAVTFIGFVGYLPNVLGFSWLAVYLQQGVGLRPAEMAAYLTSLALCLIVITFVLSRLCRRALRGGASFRGAMVLPPMIACTLGGSAFLLLAVLPKDRFVTLGLYAVGSIAINLLPAFGFAIVGHIAPACRRGGLLAIHNGLVTTAGIVAPGLVGWLISRAGGDVAGGMNSFFVLLGSVAALAGLAGSLLVDPERARHSMTTPRPAVQGRPH